MSREEDPEEGREPADPVEVEIGDALDLHRFAPAETLDVLDAYLDAAREAGLREVRIIHGRGRGVQRARVQAFLASDARVERVQEAPAGRGGWGATLAWLRSPERDG
jgi:DNA-nicking Smr family endonuclease